MGTQLVSAAVGGVHIQLLLRSGGGAGVGQSWKHQTLPSNICGAKENRQKLRNQRNSSIRVHRGFFSHFRPPVGSVGLIQASMLCFAAVTYLIRKIPVLEELLT